MVFHQQHLYAVGQLEAHRLRHVDRTGRRVLDFLVRGSRLATLPIRNSANQGRDRKGMFAAKAAEPHYFFSSTGSMVAMVRLFTVNISLATRCMSAGATASSLSSWPNRLRQSPVSTRQSASALASCLVSPNLPTNPARARRLTPSNSSALANS